MRGVRIRPATRADLSALQGVEEDADHLFIERFQPSRWGAGRAGEARASDGGFVLVAEVDDAVVGFAHVLLPPGLAHLEALVMRTEYGQRGIGSSLLTEAMAEVGRRGYSHLTLRTYANVPWNAPFYARFGFVEDTPATAFHRSLIKAEEAEGLMAYGRRIQMRADIPPGGELSESNHSSV